MKNQFRLFTVLLSLLLFISSCEKEPMSSDAISDQNFLASLIEAGVDTNGDGNISSSEAESVESLIWFWIASEILQELRCLLI